MKQTMVSKIASPLLDYAISKLTPEIFSHPVWVRFGNQKSGDTSRITEILSSVAQQLQEDSPSDACQLMLACSVFQNHANRSKDALETIQNVIALAKRTSLTRELLWANWGVSAVCIQQGNYQQAAVHLDDLVATLSGENEWVLADFVDVIKQSLSSATQDNRGNHPDSFHDQPLDDILTLTFDWMQHWGFSSPETPLDPIPAYLPEPTARLTTRSPSSGQRWRDWWHNFKLAIRNGLNLHQTKKSFSIHPAVFEKKRDSSGTIRPQAVVDAELQPDEKDLRSSTQIMIYCLGPLRVLNDKNFVTNWPSRKAQLVFKYLLLHRHTQVHKETIMEAFWPEADVESARRNLHQAIYSLRLTLKGIDDGLDIIEFEQDGYRINPAIDVWIDYIVFEQHYTTAQHKEQVGFTDQALVEYALAEEMYIDHLFSEDLYEDWIRSQREYLWQLYLSAATRLAGYHIRKKDFSAAISIGQRILQKDSCEETAHQILMQCFHSQGQRQLAIRQYEMCRQALKDELDVEPSNRTKQLFLEILND
jgi:DNA-binding SARP family transcriptional activator